MRNNLKISFVGLSHLGLISAISASLKNFEVTAFDTDINKIKNFKRGIFDIEEPNLYKNYNKIKNKIIFTYNKKNLKNSDITYFSLDVPTNKNNQSSTIKLKNMINTILPVLKKKSIVIILSQVNPGFTFKLNWPKDYLYYQVETLIFGNAFNRAMHPERIIVGASNNQIISKAYENFLKKFSKNIILMNYSEAELTKISINLFLSSTISITNLIDQYCEINKLNWKKIIPALKLDRRIGKYAYLQPGLGISGGNLERDLYSFKKLLSKSKINFDLIDSIIKFSEMRKNWVIDKLKSNIKNIKNVAILGVAYKEETNSIKNSPTMSVINYISRYPINIKLYDPLIVRYKNYKIDKVINKEIENYECIIVMNKSKSFYNINKYNLYNSKLKLLIDPFEVVKSNENKKTKYLKHIM